MAKSKSTNRSRPPRLTSADRVKRDAQIVAAARRGLDFEQIAASFELTADSCRRIVREFRVSNPPLAPAAPEEELAELHEIYAGAISELGLVSASTGHAGARVAAI